MHPASCLLKLVFVLFSILIVLSPLHAVHDDENFFKFDKQFEYEKDNKRSKLSATLVVSTIDGKVTCLDLNNRGKLLWSTQVGDEPLIQSSLTKLLIKENNKVIRLIPSLNGNLFRFDGKSVEAVPYTAEQLLSSTFRVSENQLLVGGKDVTTIGLDSATGRAIYVCSSDGCKKLSQAASNTNVIIVKRQQQTVRSVESRHGTENWNFSVGELGLDVVRGNAGNLLSLTNNDIYEDEFQQKFTHDFNFCKDSFYDVDSEESPCDIIKTLKVKVPEGTVCSVDDNKSILWRHKFKSPIANVWAIVNGHTIKIDLFNPTFVPALESSSDEMESSSIYLGSYGEFFYIQSSDEIRDAVRSAALSHNRPRKGILNPYYALPIFAYHPYLGNGDHLTEATIGQADDGEVAVDGIPDRDGKCENQLAVYMEKPLSYRGFYFKSENIRQQHQQQQHTGIRENHRKGRVTINSDFNQSNNEFSFDDLSLLASMYWKELIILTLTFSFLFQILIAKCYQVFKEKKEQLPSSSDSAEYTDAKASPSPEVSDAQMAQEYQSRFLHDFIPVRRLGKGGFGVVFEVRNKVDDCSYAVKRITLPNKLKARDKVMREVRALAKLEHPCIVRYFHSWTEQPPTGWQQNHDKQWVDDLSQTGTFFPSQSSPYKRSTEQSLSMLNYYSTTQEEEQDNQYSNFKTQSFAVSKQQKGDSGSFIIFDGTDQSNRGKFFETNGESSSGTESSDDNIETNHEIQPKTSKPFQRYGHSRGDSFSIVFENDDSAIEVERNASASSYQIPFNEMTENSSPKLRKRSISHKLQSSEHTGSNSELNQVICKDGSKTTRPTTLSTSMDSPSTVYLYIQMQLCKKESLSEWLASTIDRMPNHCMWIFQQVTSAVEYIHEKNLIHRDLKPSNIFFSHDGSVKVGDFGLVTELDEGQGFTTSTPFNGSPTKQREKQGHTEQVGTKMYMAPEQMSSSNYTQKVDIFALGLVLIELLVPYGTQMERIRTLIDARRQKFPTTFKKKHPNEATLVSTMLSERADDRPSANEIINHETLTSLENYDIAGNIQITKRNRTLSTKSSLSNSL